MERVDAEAGMDKPTQAVILAGGRGERLRPLTDTLPKPMIPFHGKPFLQYLVEHLRDRGFGRILLLLGYLPRVVQEHFGDGKAFGVRIDYSVSDVDHDTGMRIRLASGMLDSRFLLMYCDNYWPMRPDAMWDRFIRSGASAQITVYGNKDVYSKDNVRLDARGMVACYDKARQAPGLKGVDIGFAFVDRGVLDLLPGGNVNFEKAVYPTLCAQGRLSAFPTDHRYYSVGSHERLPLTGMFLRRCPAAILDRDGVLNVRAPKAEYVRTPEDFRWLPGAVEAVRLLKEAGHRVIVVTNQAGIARGMMTEEDLAGIHDRMRADLRAAGADVDAVYHCPHGWDEGCECRKPRPGMLFRAQRDFHLDLSRVPFIGDDERDREAGEAAGCPTLTVDPDWSLLRIVRERILPASCP